MLQAGNYLSHGQRLLTFGMSNVTLDWKKQWTRNSFSQNWKPVHGHTFLEGSPSMIPILCALTFIGVTVSIVFTKSSF